MGAQLNQIGAEDDGTAIEVVGGDAVVEVVEVPRIEDEVEEDEDIILVDMIRWLVTGAGCMAFGPRLSQHQFPVIEWWQL